MFDYKDVKLKNSILKIDTQGYEYEVLLGSKKTLKKINLIQIELSLESLYTKQKNSNLITKFLNKNNFKIWNIIPGFKDKEKSRLLQYDAIFYKNPKKCLKNYYNWKVNGKILRKKLVKLSFIAAQCGRNYKLAKYENIDWVLLQRPIILT